MIDVKVFNESKNELPKYESLSAAGLDVRADFSRATKTADFKIYGNGVFYFKTEPYLILGPGSRVLIPTGLYVAIPEGYEIQVRPRSGWALKKGITILNTPGTIDADYRGEIGVILLNAGDAPVMINDGDRIGQLVLNKVETINWKSVDSTGALGDTERGDGGFGHGGVR